jgi:hypothetical protein
MERTIAYKTLHSNMYLVKESNLAIGSHCVGRRQGAWCTNRLLSRIVCEELLDVGSAVLYGDTTFHSWWSGEEMLKLHRTSRSHRDQVQFGVAPFSVVSPLGSLIPS